jgi:hypothetical protein
MSATLKEGQVLICNARLGYPKLWEAQGLKGDPSSKPRFGCQIMLPKSDTKTKAKIDAEVERLSKVHFKGKVPKMKDLCIKDGDGEEGDETTEGFWLISANRAETQGRPAVVAKDGRTALLPADGKPYAGCWCNFLISLYVPKNWGKVCAGLEIVQFVKDDEPFGGSAPAPADVMPDLSDDDEDEDI